jgi:hypothetical protein
VLTVSVSLALIDLIIDLVPLRPEPPGTRPNARDLSRLCKCLILSS